MVLARFAVSGWGAALPHERVRNKDLARRLDTTDEWISARTGITERRICGPGESTGSLAATAARQALVHAGVTPEAVDAILVATSTPEQPMPSTAACIGAELGTTAGVFDINAACAGFSYGVVVSGSLIQSGAAQTVLVVGADTMTRFVDPADRSTAVLFGDGAGAVVLTATTTPSDGLVACDLAGDPEAADLLVIPAGGSARPVSVETLTSGGHYLRMDGREVFRRAVRAVTESIAVTLRRAGCSVEDVDVFVPHQANARIIEAVLGRVGLSADRTILTVDRHGNTCSASVPLALSEAAEVGSLRDGNLVLVSGYGAGLTVGTCLLRWRTAIRRTELSRSN